MGKSLDFIKTYQLKRYFHSIAGNIYLEKVSLVIVVNIPEHLSS